MPDFSTKPFVSVILPVRNEERYLERSLGAVLDQDYPSDRYEVIVVDGASTDGTRAEVERLQGDRRGTAVSLLENPGQITPVSMNIGIDAATGDYIVRIDGHCEPAPDYLSRCVELLESTGYECVGGVCETVGETKDARAIAAAQSSRFGVGNVAFRVQQVEAGITDTVPFGAWPRSVFDRIGTFDEELVRNQDDEFLFRLAQAGGRVWYDPSIRSRYFSRAGFGSLWRQYHQYGVYKVRVAQKRGGFSSPRHLVPAAFVVGVAGSALLSLTRRQARWFVAVAGTYTVANTIAARQVAARSQVAAPKVSLAFLILHTSYGLGTLAGLWRWRRHFLRP